MPLFDHLCVTVDDVPLAARQFGAILEAFGFERTDENGSVSWYREGETEFAVLPAREAGTGPHVHGRVGWQHLAFAVETPEEVDRMHAIAVDAGFAVVRAPKKYPRFTERYYASFLEDANGIRIEFMYNPPAVSRTT